MKQVFTLVVAAAVGGSLSFVSLAAAGNMDEEIAAALVHAHAAEQMDTLSGVHLHLHHVLNCVLGPGSKLYSAKAEALSEHPCKGLGNGALPDAGHDRAERVSLEQAARAAERGIAASDLTRARQDAGAAVAALESAQRSTR